MPVTDQELADAKDAFVADTAIIHEMVNGDENTSITVGSGSIDSIKKLQKNITLDYSGMAANVAAIAAANTGDETTATIKTKLGVTTLSGDNTGDQTLASLAAEGTANKDAPDGYVGLTAYKINFKNALATFTSLLSNANTAVRNYVFPDKSGTVALLSDITGTNSGTNTGDETQATLLTKLDTAVWTPTSLTNVSQLTNDADYVNSTTAELVANKATDFSTINDVKYPTTSAVKTAIDAALVGVLDDRGVWDASSNTYPNTNGSGVAGAIRKGDFYYISVPGTLNGKDVTVGDSVRAMANAPGQTDANWSVLEANIGYVPYNATNPAGYTANQTDAFLLDRANHTGTQAAATIVESGTKVFVMPAEKTAITHANRAALDLVSGTNTGDQTLSSLGAEDASKKDASGGYAGLTAFKLNLRNVLNSFTSFITNSNTASRTYTLPDKDGIFAMMDDLSGLSSGTNTGDETQASILFKLGADEVTGSNTGDETTSSIKSKLSIATLSGDNTGDETQETILTKLGATVVTGSNTGDDTAATIKTKLGITTLSGSNTGDQTLGSLGAEATANKDSSGGYAGLTALKINFKNVLGTFTSFFTNSNTAARTYTFPDKDITVAGLSDITGTNSGTNTGDQTITLTGAVTGTGTGSFATTLAANIVTLANMAQVATASFLGRNTAGTGNPEVLSTATVRTMLSINNVDNTSDASKPVSTAQAAADTATLNSAKSYADSLAVGVIDDRGSYDASVNTYPTTGGRGVGGLPVKGDMWFVSVGGTLGGQVVAPGDSFRALVDTPGQTAGNWAQMDGNVGYVPVNAATQDVSGGFPGLTLLKINFMNAAATIKSFLTNTNTAPRTYTFPDKDITVAGLSDITGTNSGTNTGDETTATIKTKLGITTLSGSNTGDQTLGSLGAEATANKDATGGYAGLTAFKLNLKNAANTFTNFFTNATTAARTWTLPDKDGIIAMLSDITSSFTSQIFTLVSGNTTVIQALFRNSDVGNAAQTRIDLGNNASVNALTVGVFGSNHATKPGYAEIINQANSPLGLGAGGNVNLSIAFTGGITYSVAAGSSDNGTTGYAAYYNVLTPATTANLQRFAGAVTSDIYFGRAAGADTFIWGAVGSAAKMTFVPSSGAFAVAGQCSLGGAAGAESLRAVVVASAVNRWEVGGATTGNAPYLIPAGSDANINGQIYSKGTGTINLTTAGTGAVRVLTNNGTEQLRVTHTANAVNYPVVSGGATGNAATIGVSGSDASANLTVTGKGSGTVALPGSATGVGALITNEAKVVNVIAAAPTATQNIYLNLGASTVFTTASTVNFVLNVAMSSGTALDAALSTGASVSVVVDSLQGATPHYMTGMQIDGVALVVGTNLFWNGGVAPTSGNASGYDHYEFVITKTGSATYVVTAKASNVSSGGGLSASNFVSDEIPAGTVNGTNVTFTLANTPTAMFQLFRGGILLFPGAGNDYTRSGATITMADAPTTAAGQRLVAFYVK